MCRTLFLILTSLCLSSKGHRRVYDFIKESKTCSQAQQYCRDHYTDMASPESDPDPCPEPGGCDGAWVRNCDGGCNDGWFWLSQYDSGEENDLKRCGSVQKKPDKPLTWSSRSCTALKRYACYDSEQKEYWYSTDEKKWAQAVEYCKQRGTSLVSGCCQVEHQEFVNEIEKLGESLKWWIGLYSTKNGNHISRGEDSTCCQAFNDQSRSQEETERPFICYDDHMVLVKQSKTWEEALVHCRSEYGELATMTDDRFNRMVQAKADIAVTEHVWVGLHFSSFFEEWMWVSGQWVTSNNRNWAKKKESHHWYVSGAMKKNGKEKWFKMPSGEQFNFVCALHCSSFRDAPNEDLV